MDNSMHSNPRFNIVQAAGNCNPDFVVIEGQRTDSGHMAQGARVLSATAMPRAQAIEQADKLQAASDTHMAALLTACDLPTKDERRYGCDAAHLVFSKACEDLGVALPD